jgi:hypothetical protein
VYEQVESKLGLMFKFIGEQQVKNIPNPVRAYRFMTGQLLNTSDGAHVRAQTSMIETSRGEMCWCFRTTSPATSSRNWGVTARLNGSSCDAPPMAGAYGT